METIVLSCVRAFLVGAVFCVIAQLLIDLTAITPARILVIYVCAGIAMGALGIYEPLRRFAGCGISVPLIGFGGLIAEGTKKAVLEKGWLGVLTGGVSAAAAGIAAALCLGFLAALLFKSKPKRL